MNFIQQFDMETVIVSFPVLLKATVLTLQVTAISIVLGTIIGLFVGLARLSKNRIIRSAATMYVDFFRGTPLLVQLFILFYGMSSIFSGFEMSAFNAGIIGFSINSGAYVAEIFRSGIQSIDKGQMEAARSLGMSYIQAMVYIILPQAFKRVVPPLGNEFIALLKDTSLLSVITLEELTRKGQLIVARTYDAFEIYLSIALIYLVLTMTISQLVAWTERRLKTSDTH